MTWSSLKILVYLFALAYVVIWCFKAYNCVLLYLICCYLSGRCQLISDKIRSFFYGTPMAFNLFNLTVNCFLFEHWLSKANKSFLKEAKTWQLGLNLLIFLFINWGTFWRFCFVHCGQLVFYFKFFCFSYLNYKELNKFFHIITETVIDFNWNHCLFKHVDREMRLGVSAPFRLQKTFSFDLNQVNQLNNHCGKVNCILVAFFNVWQLFLVESKKNLFLSDGLRLRIVDEHVLLIVFLKHAVSSVLEIGHHVRIVIIRRSIESPTS